MGSSKEKKSSKSSSKKDKKESSSSSGGGGGGGELTAAAAAAGAVAGAAAAAATAAAQQAKAAAPAPPAGFAPLPTMARVPYFGYTGSSYAGASTLHPYAPPAPAAAAAAPPPPSAPATAEALGSAVLYDDYRRCLAALEEVISGPLQQKKAALAEAARGVEASMSAVQHAVEAVRAETEADTHAILERLDGSQRQKLALLQHDLSALMIDIEQIEGFVGEVAVGSGGGAQPLALLRAQPELMARARRLAAKPVAAARRVAVDDLPREAAERSRRLEHAEAMEGLLRVKDSMVASLLHDEQARERERADAAEAIERANARADATRARSVEELERWGSLADEYASRLEEMQGELDAAAHEGAALRAHNAALGAHNEQLRAHAEQLRAMLEKERAERAA